MVAFPVERITYRLAATCSTILTTGENILMNSRWAVMAPETNPERTRFRMLLRISCERLRMKKIFSGQEQVPFFVFDLQSYIYYAQTSRESTVLCSQHLSGLLHLFRLGSQRNRALNFGTATEPPSLRSLFVFENSCLTPTARIRIHLAFENIYDASSTLTAATAVR